jgi:hypothetical protein
MFSIAYPAGPEPTGNAKAFRSFLLARSPELAPANTNHTRK